MSPDGAIDLVKSYPDLALNLHCGEALDFMARGLENARREDALDVTFVFADPPCWGSDGDYSHTVDQHALHAALQQWPRYITVNKNCPEIRELYHEDWLIPVKFQNLKSKDAEEFPELVIIKSKVLSRTEDVERLREDFKRPQRLPNF